MNYVYDNVNPNYEHQPDCVCRAISLATGEAYKNVKEKLEIMADLYECETLCVCCYKNLIEKYYEFPRLHGFEGHTIREFTDEHLPGIYIVRIEGHLTTVIDGKIHDIWDCSEGIIDVIWIAAE